MIRKWKYKKSPDKDLVNSLKRELGVKNKTIDLLVQRGIVNYELGCTSSNKEFSNIEDLRIFLEQVPIVKCDEILFSLYGLSFANMNFLISLFFVILSTYLFRSYGR